MFGGINGTSERLDYKMPIINNIVTNPLKNLSIQRKIKLTIKANSNIMHMTISHTGH